MFYKKKMQLAKQLQKKILAKKTNKIKLNRNVKKYKLQLAKINKSYFC